MSKCCIIKAINIVSGSGTLTTLYTGNAALTGNRTVTGGGSTLTFDMGSSLFLVSGVVTTKGVSLPALASNAGTADTVWASGINLYRGVEPVSLLPVASEGTGSVTAALNYLTPINTSGGASTVTPPTPSGNNSRFEIVDSRGTSLTNNIVVNFSGAGQKLYGSTTQNYTLNGSGAFVRFRYLGSTIGWIAER